MKRHEMIQHVFVCTRHKSFLSAEVFSTFASKQSRLFSYEKESISSFVSQQLIANQLLDPSSIHSAIYATLSASPRNDKRLCFQRFRYLTMAFEPTNTNLSVFTFDLSLRNSHGESAVFVFFFVQLRSMCVRRENKNELRKFFFI